MFSQYKLHLNVTVEIESMLACLASHSTVESTWAWSLQIIGQPSIQYILKNETLNCMLCEADITSYKWLLR